MSHYFVTTSSLPVSHFACPSSADLTFFSLRLEEFVIFSSYKFFDAFKLCGCDLPFVSLCRELSVDIYTLQI